MFSAATIEEQVKCNTVGDLIAFLSEYDEDTPICTSLEDGLMAELHRNREDLSEICICIEEADHDDEEDDELLRGEEERLAAKLNVRPFGRENRRAQRVEGDSILAELGIRARNPNEQIHQPKSPGTRERSEA